MRYIFPFLLCFLLFFYKSNAQRKFTLNGYLAVRGGESWHYRLVFTDTNDILKGYSLTYDDENKDTKALIEGRIDRKAKMLSFHETEITYNHGFETKVTICLVDATLKYDGHALGGRLSSKDIGNADCGTGSINFINEQELKQLFSELQPVDSTPKPVPVVAAPEKKMTIIYDTVRATRPVAAMQQPDKITTGTEKEYKWTSDTLKLEVWDGGKVDGDIISVMVDDKTMLQHYTLTQTKKRIEVALPGHGVSYTVAIIAQNEGNEAPNTADILLIDRENSYHVIAYNEVGKKAVVHIRKQ